jgi:hypothetical protein
MAKFKINQKVALREGSNYEVVNEIGVIKAREVRQVGNKTEVRYLVDFGGGMENWLILTRKDLKSATEIVNKEIFKIKTYKLDKGMILPSRHVCLSIMIMYMIRIMNLRTRSIGRYYQSVFQYITELMNMMRR